MHYLVNSFLKIVLSIKLLLLIHYNKITLWNVQTLKEMMIVGYTYLSDKHTIIVFIDFMYTSKVLRIFILILLWNQEMLYSLMICFHEKKHEKIIHLRERLRLT